MKFLQAHAVAATLVFACATAAHADDSLSVGDAGYDTPDLATTTAPPWNPAGPMPHARPWERALRAPGAVISWPIVQAGHGLESAMTWAEENSYQARVAAFLARKGTWGVDLVPASLGEGTGFGLEFRTTPVFALRHVSGAVSASTGGYNREQLTLSLGRLALDWQNDWRPREHFFGVGMTPRSGISTYGVRTQSALLSFSVGTPFGAKTIVAPLPPHEGALIPPTFEHRTLLRVWAGPRDALMTTGRDFDLPSIEIAHPGLAEATLHDRVEQMSYGLTVAHDGRHGTPHWTHGWRAAGEIERREDPWRGLRLHETGVDARSFTRLTGTVETGLSFGRDPRTIRLALKTVDTRLDRSGGVFLLDDLPSLGGADLAGFERGRFRDRDLVLGKLSYVYPILRNAEMELHVESGQVAPGYDALRFARQEQSAGFAFRLRMDTSMVGAVGMDFSRESARVRFALGGVE